MKMRLLNDNQTPMRLPKIRVRLGRSGKGLQLPKIRFPKIPKLWGQFFLSTVAIAIATWIALPPQFDLPLYRALRGLPENIRSALPTEQLPEAIRFTKPSIILPGSSTDLGHITLRQGLDIQGGTQVTLEADMSQIEESQRSLALESAREVLRRRVDLFGVAEPRLRTSVFQDTYRIIIELPGLDQPAAALQLIGQTAQLQFWESDVQPEATMSAVSYLETFTPTELTGKQLDRAQVQFDPTTGAPVVALQFNGEGTQLFAQITERNIGKPVGIYLDNQPITLPVVNEAIYGGQAVIQGQFDIATAETLTAQLNAGSLPVPISVVEQTTVGPTLGQTSLQESVRAGLIGIFLVAVFMVLLYRSAGFLAVLGLVAYGIITITLYKLIPVTLTLPGIAGLLLSIGMAVDANILTFERIKEELRAGKSHQQAVKLGFGRAWSSIKDANLATLAITFILFNPLNWSFLNSSGPVRGFAVTLALGIFISLFTGVVYSRLLLQLFWDPEELQEGQGRKS